MDLVLTFADGIKTGWNSPRRFVNSRQIHAVRAGLRPQVLPPVGSLSGCRDLILRVPITGGCRTDGCPCAGRREGDGALPTGHHGLPLSAQESAHWHGVAFAEPVASGAGRGEVGEKLPRFLFLDPLAGGLAVGGFQERVGVEQHQVLDLEDAGFQTALPSGMEVLRTLATVAPYHLPPFLVAMPPALRRRAVSLAL